MYGRKIKVSVQRDLIDECIQIMVTTIHNVLSNRYETCYMKQKQAILKGESINRKRDQKEASVSLVEFYHHVTILIYSQ